MSERDVVATWDIALSDGKHRIQFEHGTTTEKDTMEVWVNGVVVETAGEFVDDGTETHFTWANHTCYIKAISSGKKKDGIIHSLIIDSNEIPETMDE